MANSLYLVVIKSIPKQIKTSMKKILTTLFFGALLCFITNSLNAQFYLGYSKAETIKKIREKEGNNFEISQINLEDGNIAMIWKPREEVSQIIYFEKNGLSSMFCMIPSNNEALKTLTEVFNESFIVISSTEWKSYRKDKIYKIILGYVENLNKYAFTFVLE